MLQLCPSREMFSTCDDLCFLPSLYLKAQILGVSTFFCTIKGRFLSMSKSTRTDDSSVLSVLDCYIYWNHPLPVSTASLLINTIHCSIQLCNCQPPNSYCFGSFLSLLVLLLTVRSSPLHNPISIAIFIAICHISMIVRSTLRQCPTDQSYTVYVGKPAVSQFPVSECRFF